MFFVLALGRSGTSFLASLLGQDRRALVHHEPYPMDGHLLFLRRSGRFETVVDSLLEERFRKLLPDSPSVQIYGEVNSSLRCQAAWLKKRFAPTLLHLVRDGRDFVRSAYIRGVYTDTESLAPVVPRDEDPFASRWVDMSRFERLCWYWMHTNEDLAESVPDALVRLEDIVRSYAYFEERVLRPTGIALPEGIWRRERHRPKNTSREYTLRARVMSTLRLREAPRIEPLPPWAQWETWRKEAFWDICGATMTKFGYRR